MRAAGDEALIAAARSGDREAFGALFDRYRDYAFSIALERVGTEHDACDVVQDAFVKVLTRLHDIRRADRFRPWLAKIVVRTALDHHRRRRATVAVDEQSWVGEAPAPSDRLDAHRRVRRAVRALGPRLRAAVLLRYVGGWSYERIARRLGVSMGTVASRLARAHAQLKAHMETVNGGRS